MCLKTARWVANSVDLDHMPHTEASDLGLHFLFRPDCRNTLGYYSTSTLLKSLKKNYHHIQMKIYPVIIKIITFLDLWSTLFVVTRQQKMLSSAMYPLQLQQQIYYLIMAACKQ